MTDTIRSQADLLALFADNTSGAISAQDARDLIVTTVPKPVYQKTLTVAGVLDLAGVPDHAQVDVRPFGGGVETITSIINYTIGNEATIFCGLGIPMNVLGFVDTGIVSTYNGPNGSTSSQSQFCVLNVDINRLDLVFVAVSIIIALETANTMPAQGRTTAEINAVTGMIEGDWYWDSTLHVMKIYNGTAWKTVTMT